MKIKTEGKGFDMRGMLFAILLACPSAVRACEDSRVKDVSPPAVKPQWQRMLAGDDERQAAVLSRQISALKNRGSRAEALSVAEELVRFREARQGADHWEVRSARLEVEELRQPRTAAELARLEHAAQLDRDAEKQFLDEDYGRSEMLFQQSWSIRQEVLGARHPDTITSVNNLAVVYDAQGKYAQALPLFEAALQSNREVLGNRHPDTAASMHDLAGAFQSQKRLNEAESLFREALEVRRDLFHKHPETVGTLQDLAGLYKSQARFAAAEPLLLECVAITAELVGRKHEDTATHIAALAAFYQSQGKYEAAEPLSREALAIRREVRPAKDTQTASSLTQLGLVLRALDRLGEAEPLLEQALAMQRELTGASSQTATSLMNLGALYVNQARYGAAEPLMREAIQIRLKLRGKNHRETAGDLHNLARLYESQGEYGKAESLFREALRIRLEVSPPDDKSTAASLLGLASIYSLQGQFVAAEPLLLEALRLRRKALGNQHPDTAEALGSLASLYRRQFRLKEAEAFQAEAAEIWQQLAGDKQTLQNAALRNALAIHHMAQEDFAKAEQCFRQVLEIRRQILGTGGQQLLIADSLNNLAAVCDAQKKYGEAEELYRESLHLLKLVLDARHPRIAVTLNNLAAVFLAHGRFDAAEETLRQVVQVRREALGSRHPDTATAWNNLAAVYFLQGNYEEAQRTLRECVRSYEASRIMHARATERSLGTEGRSPYSMLAAAHARLAEPGAAFEALEFATARGLLDEQLSRRPPTDHPEERDQIREVTAQLESMTPQIVDYLLSNKRTPAEQQDLEGLLRTRQELEDRCADLASASSRREVADWPAIQAEIPAGAAFVAWLDVSFRQGSYADRWGCVLRRAGEPAWVPLPGTGPVGSWTADDATLAERFRRALTQGASEPEVAELARQLHAQRLAPLLPHLRGVDTLYVAGVRHMAGVPVEVLAPEYTISYVPSGTFLARRTKMSERPATLLALGDPVFPTKNSPGTSDELPSGLLIRQVVPGGPADQHRLRSGDVLVTYAGVPLESLKHFEQLLTAHRGDATVGIQIWRPPGQVADYRIAPGPLGVVLSPEPARDVLLKRRKAEELLASRTRGDAWEELPGSQVELAELSRIFEPQVTTALMREHAQEEALERLRRAGELRKFRYLHFATHGEASQVRAFDARLILSQDARPLPEPGQPRWDNELTAKEVLEHWQLDAELVTLSACETAVGPLAGGDGMLGFAQAFLLSGARSVCLSLWKVDDTATALLMDRFYRNLRGKREDRQPPMAKAAALAEAKVWLRGLTFREATDRLGVITEGLSRGSRKGPKILKALPPADDSPKEIHPYAHPKYWAAFVLIGDPD